MTSYGPWHWKMLPWNMVNKWWAAARVLGSNTFEITATTRRQWQFNTQPYGSVCVGIVPLSFTSVTPKIISLRILEHSQFSSCSVSIFQYASVLSCMGPYTFPVLSTTCGAFSILLLNILLSLTLYSEYNWILIHTALYASLRITNLTIIILPLLCFEIHDNTTQYNPILNDTAIFPTAKTLNEIFNSIDKWTNSVCFSILHCIAPYIWGTVSVSINRFWRNPWLGWSLNDGIVSPNTALYGTIHADTSIFGLSSFKEILCSFGLN